MRKGKMVAQGAHASMKAILDSMIDVEEEKVLYLEPGTPMEDWINGIFTKICVSVDSEEELLELYNNAKIQGYNAALIQDAGLTEFGGVPTYTCCAIGPNWEDEVNAITGHLKLL
jgi:PTH2 family peptidyl-tRNA hydrolase